jgi:hypothetical protein
MNRLIQMGAAAGFRLLISAAAHRVRPVPVRAGCSFRAHPGFWLRNHQFGTGSSPHAKSGP